MKFVTLFLICMCIAEVFSANSKLTLFDRSSLSSALEILTKIMFEGRKELLIINCGESRSLMGSMLIRNLHGEVLPSRIWRIPKPSMYKSIAMRESAIIILDSVNTLRVFNEKVLFMNKSPRIFKFLIYCQHATFEDISILIENESTSITHERDYKEVKVGHILQYQYFLVDDVECVRLLTFIWFSPNKCNRKQLIEVNRFDKATKKWKSSDFFIDKFKNFHGCRIRICFWSHQLAFRERGNVESGYHLEIIKGLQSHLNFKYVGPSSDDCQLSKTHPIDLVLTYACYNPNIIVPMFMLRPFYFPGHFMTVPPGSEVEGFEKLLMPFDYTTWSLVLLTFLLAFAAIFVTKFVTNRTRNCIFGSSKPIPFLDIGIIFFGISQVQLPRKTFARFLIMVFVLYSLIIRTAWQGKTFEFLQKEVRKVEVQSIDEMIGKNFTFYMKCGYKAYFKDSIINQR